MVTDCNGAQLTEGDLVEAFSPADGVFPARVEQFQPVCGKNELSLTRMDTGEKVLRWHDAVIKMSGD